MNQKFNAWLCKHFDKERTESDDYGRKHTLPKKGYVTFWDIFEAVIIEPLIICVIIALVLFLVLIIPGGLIVSLENIQPLSSWEIVNSLIYGLLFWVVIGLFYVIIHGIYKLMQCKVAVCPLTEKKLDEFGAPQDDDSRLRPDLKEAEEKMFKDILQDGDM